MAECQPVISGRNPSYEGHSHLPPPLAVTKNVLCSHTTSDAEDPCAVGESCSKKSRCSTECRARSQSNIFSSFSFSTIDDRNRSLEHRHRGPGIAANSISVNCNHPSSKSKSRGRLYDQTSTSAGLVTGSHRSTSAKQNYCADNSSGSATIGRSSLPAFDAEEGSGRSRAASLFSRAGSSCIFGGKSFCFDDSEFADINAIVEQLGITETSPLPRYRYHNDEEAEIHHRWDVLYKSETDKAGGNIGSVHKKDTSMFRYLSAAVSRNGLDTPSPSQAQPLSASLTESAAASDLNLQYKPQLFSNENRNSTIAMNQTIEDMPSEGQRNDITFFTKAEGQAAATNAIGCDDDADDDHRAITPYLESLGLLQSNRHESPATTAMQDVIENESITTKVIHAKKRQSTKLDDENTVQMSEASKRTADATEKHPKQPRPPTNRKNDFWDDKNSYWNREVAKTGSQRAGSIAEVVRDRHVHTHVPDMDEVIRWALATNQGMTPLPPGASSARGLNGRSRSRSASSATGAANGRRPQRSMTTKQKLMSKAFVTEQRSPMRHGNDSHVLVESSFHNSSDNKMRGVDDVNGDSPGVRIIRRGGGSTIKRRATKENNNHEISTPLHSNANRRALTPVGAPSMRSDKTKHMTSPKSRSNQKMYLDEDEISNASSPDASPAYKLRRCHENDQSDSIDDDDANFMDTKQVQGLSPLLDEMSTKLLLPRTPRPTNPTHSNSLIASNPRVKHKSKLSTPTIRHAGKKLCTDGISRSQSHERRVTHLRSGSSVNTKSTTVAKSNKNDAPAVTTPVRRDKTLSTTYTPHPTPLLTLNITPVDAPKTALKGRDRYSTVVPDPTLFKTETKGATSQNKQNEVRGESHKNHVKSSSYLDSQGLEDGQLPHVSRLLDYPGGNDDDEENAFGSRNSSSDDDADCSGRNIITEEEGNSFKHPSNAHPHVQEPPRRSWATNNYYQPECTTVPRSRRRTPPETSTRNTSRGRGSPAQADKKKMDSAAHPPLRVARSVGHPDDVFNPDNDERRRIDTPNARQQWRRKQSSPGTSSSHKKTSTYSDSKRRRPNSRSDSAGSDVRSGLPPQKKMLINDDVEFDHSLDDDDDDVNDRHRRYSHRPPKVVAQATNTHHRRPSKDTDDDRITNFPNASQVFSGPRKGGSSKVPSKDPLMSFIDHAFGSANISQAGSQHARATRMFGGGSMFGRYYI